MSAQAIPLLSEEQYLAFERASDTKHEFYRGKIYAMSGGTYRHARIIMNLGSELNVALKGTQCAVASSDLRVRTVDGLYTYPDVVVVCGEVQLADSKRDTLVNPTLIVEVLSNSTEAYDRGFKAAKYRAIPTLREYAVVSQNEPRIEIFLRRSNDEWVLSESVGLAAQVHFRSIDRTVRIADLYDKLDFALEPSDDTHPHA